jgi:hypothetical protein
MDDANLLPPPNGQGDSTKLEGKRQKAFRRELTEFTRIKRPKAERVLSGTQEIKKRRGKNGIGKDVFFEYG